jgi:methylenetetrahydrofolate reductase (NADPH)
VLEQKLPSARLPNLSLTEAISQLARDASIEINVQDCKHLPASRALLLPGKKIYVSYLPRQSWKHTQETCVAVRAAGFEPVPHVPVRLMADEATLERTLRSLVTSAQVEEVLLIAGDYPTAVGPYASVADVLRSAVLADTGLARVSLAGHPEGHPKVARDEIRRAEREKVRLAASVGLEASLLTQFFFEPRPFLEWVGKLRADGVHTTTVAGLAGPARLATLFKFAVRCGAGPSVRALGRHPGSLLQLVGEHGPESLVLALAQALLNGESDFSRIHLFCFGGYLRTCAWLHAVASGRFSLRGSGFVVAAPAQA